MEEEGQDCWCGGLHLLFKAQVERTPGHIALMFEGQQLTYQQLNERTNRLAHALRNAGVRPEVLVGVYMERSLELVVALLAILKAGGAYVPLDPTYPPERIAFMLADAQVPLLLTQSSLQSRLPACQARVLCLDLAPQALMQEESTNLYSRVSPDDLAYVIYTSGSTGIPKGAMNTQRAICNRLLWMQAAYQLKSADRVLQKTPFSFDVSVWEFFWPLITGATLVLARPGGHKDSAYLAALTIDQQITTLHFVPSMLHVFLEEPAVARCQSLRQVICSGEALSFALQEQFFARLPATVALHNLYGPTEAAVDVTYWACQRESREGPVPIGYPIDNVQVFILDQRGQRVPDGAQGELYIGGVAVGRGYLHRPALTAEKFVPDPFSAVPGTRLYRTGDLARILPDGSTEFLGRIDDQVKLRGFRIELGEIETALCAHPAVKQVAVVKKTEEGEDCLLACFVPAQATLPSSKELRDFLQRTLPEYMLPAQFGIVDALPLTPSGKLDRRAIVTLAQSIDAVDEQVPEDPRSTLERMVAEAWQSVLGGKRCGFGDNFFEVGGTSLMAMRIVSRLQRLLQLEIPLDVFFVAPSIEAFARALEELLLSDM